MSKFLAASRKLIDAAVSLHLSSLRRAVKKSDRKVAAAMRRTDVATVAVHEAQYLLADAEEQERSAHKAEQAEADRHGAFVIAANAEAASLRRGAVI